MARMTLLAILMTISGFLHAEEVRSLYLDRKLPIEIKSTNAYSEEDQPLADRVAGRMLPVLSRLMVENAPRIYALKITSLRQEKGEFHLKYELNLQEYTALLDAEAEKLIAQDSEVKDYEFAPTWYELEKMKSEVQPDGKKAYLIEIMTGEFVTGSELMAKTLIKASKAEGGIQCANAPVINNLNVSVDKAKKYLWVNAGFDLALNLEQCELKPVFK